MKIELFKDKSLHDSAMEKFDFLYSKFKKINASSYREAFIEAVLGEGASVAYGTYGIDPKNSSPSMTANFLVFARGGGFYACDFAVNFKRDILVFYRFENLLTAAYFLALFEEAGKAFAIIKKRQPRDFEKHCEAVARQIDMYGERIEDELKKY